MKAQHKALWYQGSLAIALSSALFVVMLGGVLAFNQMQGKVATLVKSRELVRLHEELRRQPKDEELKQRIRRLDLQLREKTFHGLQLSHNGSRALVFGLVAFLSSANLARSLRKQPPNPLAWGARQSKEERTTTRVARYAVAGIFALVACAAVTLSLRPVQLPERTAPAVAENLPTPEEIAANWASFRGPGGQGVAKTASLPLPWSVRWKSPVPLSGMSSPVLWGDSVFLTGATTNENRVFRFDAETGKLLWSSAVHLPGGVRPPNPKVGDDTGFAASTPVTDGRRVYAIFANGEVAAFDFSGKQVWARNVGPVDNAYGYASSLAIYQDRLLIQIDRGQPEDAQSKLVALDTRTGQERWQVPREVAGSWASPIVIEVNNQPQLITCAAPFVSAYNPLNGVELWQVNCLESDVAPSPIFAGGLVVAVAPNTTVLALTPGTTNIVWKSDEGVPDSVSPVSDGQRLYTVTAGGELTCFNLQAGKVLWTHEFDDHFYASPTIVGNALVLLSRKGVAYIIETGDAYHELGKGEIGEECGASPVPHEASLYIRGGQHLFCIERAQR